MRTTYVGPGILSGFFAGIVTYIYARIVTEPLVSRAIDYESMRGEVQAHLSGTHEHEHELFSRAMQANVGAGVGAVVVATAMGGFFAIAFTLLWTALQRLQITADARVVGVLLAAAMFVAIYLVPALVYPPNPPAVGEADTIGVRTGAYLTMVIVSVIAMCVATAALLALRARIGGLLAALASIAGYLVVVGGTAALLPSFNEVPTPLEVSGQIEAPGFPADLLAAFRFASVGGQAVLWATLGIGFALIVTWMSARAKANASATGDSRTDLIDSVPVA